MRGQGPVSNALRAAAIARFHIGLAGLRIAAERSRHGRGDALQRAAFAGIAFAVDQHR